MSHDVHTAYNKDRGCSCVQSYYVICLNTCALWATDQDTVFPRIHKSAETIQGRKLFAEIRQLCFCVPDSSQSLDFFKTMPNVRAIFWLFRHSVQ